MKNLIFIIFIIFTMQACSENAQLVSKKETLSISSGYLFGTINKIEWKSKADIGIVIRNEFGYEKIIIPSNDDNKFLVKIKPGRYYLYGVAIVSGLTKSSPEYYPFSINTVNTIDVNQNEVTYIGDFSFLSKVSERQGWFRHVVIVTKVNDLFVQSSKDFRNTFKNFNNVQLINKYKESINNNLPLGFQQLCTALTGCLGHFTPLKIIQKEKQ